MTITIQETVFNLIVNDATQNLTVTEVVNNVSVSANTVLGIRGVGFKTITVGPTEPENPSLGDIWINTN